MQAKHFLNKKYYHYVNYPNSQSKKGDVDPWGKVSKTISNYLKEIGMLEHYKKTLNSLAFTASIISIYRITSKYNFKDSLNQSKHVLKNFKKYHSYNLDIDSLEIRTKIILPFAKLNMVLPIVILAKFKKLKQKNNKKFLNLFLGINQLI